MRLDLAFRKKCASLPTAETKESKNYPIRRSRDSLPSLAVIEGPMGVYLYKHCPNGLTKSWENKEQHLDDLFLESSGENGAAGSG